MLTPRRNFRFCHRAIPWLLVIGLLLASFAPARAFAAFNPLEYQVKAGFLFNFAKFIEWPGATLAPGASLRLGILAPDDVYAVMEKALSGKTAGDHPLVIQRVTLADLESGGNLPNIIFINQDVFRTRNDSGLTQQQIVVLAEKQTVLLVGESAGFATAGGMIGFVQRGENLRFQVNLASAQRAGLKLSARLSGLAEIVTPANP